MKKISIKLFLYICKKNILKKTKSSLSVQKGVEKPSMINPNIARKFRENKKKIDVSELKNQILSGNVTALGQGITLIESSLPLHKKQTEKLLSACYPFSGKSLRIGITGVPGAGKSTFIESFGTTLTEKGKKVAVLAIDPSSTRTGGSILGDKTRMEKLSANNMAFIRPSPSAGSLGGVANKTAEAIILCEAAGFDIIIVETVGVGQSEIAVHGMTDFFLLLMIAGAGDELQGIKRGIMEMADALIINKADGENVLKAKAAEIEYKGAMHLFPPSASGWITKTASVSSISGNGIDEVADIIFNYEKETKANNYFFENRKKQEQKRVSDIIQAEIADLINKNPMVVEKLINSEEQKSPTEIANELLALVLK